MKPRHLLMGVALLGAAALLVLGDNRPDSAVAEPVVRALPNGGAARLQARAQASAVLATPPAAPTAPAAGRASPTILHLLPRAALLDQAAAAPAGMFASRDWTPPPPPPPPPAPAPPAAPPSAPPLPFTLLGKAVENGAWEVYLGRAGKTYIVKPKTVIDGTYRVDAIAPPLLTLTYLPLNQVQQLNIGAFD
jgi:hypothetical protein